MCRFHPVSALLFRLGFIALFQCAILFCLALPGAVAAAADDAMGPTASWASFGPIDVALFVAWCLFFAGEWRADDAQQAFQRRRAAVRRSPRGRKAPRGGGSGQDAVRRWDPALSDEERGFLTRGPGGHGLVRRPAYACEQGMWIVVALWGLRAAAVASSTGAVASAASRAVASSDASQWWLWPAWSVAGAMTLVGLFQGSTDLTDRLSDARHPDHAEWRRRRWALLPSPRALADWVAGRDAAA